MEQNIKLLKKLIFCVLAHLVVSSVTIMLWVVNVVFFLKKYSAISNVIDPYNLFLFGFNFCTIIYLCLFIHIRKPHELIKVKALSIIECSVWSIAVLIVYIAMELGVSKALDAILFYLPPDSEVRHFENIIFTSVSVFPLFLFAFIFIILYTDYRVYRMLTSCMNNVATGTNIDKLWQEEQQTEIEANRRY